MRRQIGIGAAGIVALSILPVVGLIAPLLGGGLAGRYTDDSPERGALVGAGAGAVASLIALPLALAAGVAAAATAWPLAAAVFAGTIALVLYNTGLGALGGYAGRLLATDDETAASATPSVDTNATVDRLREKYLDDAVDEVEFERRLERAMRDDDSRQDRDSSVGTEPDASVGTDRNTSADTDRETVDERRSDR